MRVFGGRSKRRVLTSGFELNSPPHMFLSWTFVKASSQYFKVVVVVVVVVVVEPDL